MGCEVLEELLGLECAEAEPGTLLIREQGHQPGGPLAGKPYWVLEAREVPTIETPQEMLNHWGVFVTSQAAVDDAGVKITAAMAAEEQELTQKVAAMGITVTEPTKEEIAQGEPQTGRHLFEVELGQRVEPERLELPVNGEYQPVQRLQRVVAFEPAQDIAVGQVRQRRGWPRHIGRGCNPRQRTRQLVRRLG